MTMTIGNYEYIAGKVTEVTVREKSVLMKLLTSVYQKEEKKRYDETVELVFANSNENNYTDRFSKLDVVDSDILVKARKDDRDNYFGYQFIFPGNIMKCAYKGKDGSDKVANIYFGKVNIFDNKVTKTSTGKERLSGSIGVSKKDESGNKETEWISITFWNNDDNPLATKAYKLLADTPVAILRLGEISEYTKKDGTTGQSASVNKFLVYAFKSKDKDEAPADSESSGTTAPAASPASSVFSSDLDDDDDEYSGF